VPAGKTCRKSIIYAIQHRLLNARCKDGLLKSAIFKLGRRKEFHMEIIISIIAISYDFFTNFTLSSCIIDFVL